MPSNPARVPVRVIVHAGFHKTGTTSLQDFLKKNQPALEKYYRYYGKLDFRSAGAHARIYGQRPFPWRLWRFRRSFRRFLNGIDDFHTIILSRETFSGGMPGHRKFGGRMMTSYQNAAKPLARVIVAELRRRFRPGVDISFVYTLRNTDSWITSVHGHLLRSTRLQDDLHDFIARFPNLTGPKDAATHMADYLDPIPVKTIQLEKFASHSSGPAAGILDLLNIPADVRGTLAPARRSNAGQSKEIREMFLDLNHTEQRKRALKAKKTALIAAKTEPRPT